MKGKVVSVEIFKKLQQRLKTAEDIIKRLPSKREIKKVLCKEIEENKETIINTELDFESFSKVVDDLAKVIHKRIGV